MRQSDKYQLLPWPAIYPAAGLDALAGIRTSTFLGTRRIPLAIGNEMNRN